ncbi:hypothetical protein FKM82_016548 [Ascaphus truei]
MLSQKNQYISILHGGEKKPKQNSTIVPMTTIEWRIPIHFRERKLMLLKLKLLPLGIQGPVPCMILQAVAYTFLFRVSYSSDRWLVVIQRLPMQNPSSTHTFPTISIHS